jgi:hypothetical protein
MTANYAAQLDALNALFLAYQDAHANFTAPLLRIGFGNPSMPYEDLPGPPSACVWPPAGIDEREINSRLLAAQHFLKERGDLPLHIIRDISNAQIGLTASGFDETRARSLIILNPLDNIRGAIRGFPGASVTGILSTVAAENATLETVLREISVELVLLKGKIAGSTPPAAKTEKGEGIGKRFRVALSFPGERREFIEQVAAILAGNLGKEQVLYDHYHAAEFARTNLDTYLQYLYHEDSDLIAVFFCAEYESKQWCGLEWRAIRDRIKGKQDSAIMPFRFDNTSIPGLLSIDGYVEVGNQSASEIASLILKRLETNNQQNPL